MFISRRIRRDGDRVQPNCQRHRTRHYCDREGHRAEAQYDLFVNLVATEVSSQMRSLLFLACMTGVLLAVDAIRFDGRYRTEVWRDAQYKGQSFTREVENGLRRHLW